MVPYSEHESDEDDIPSLTGDFKADKIFYGFNVFDNNDI